MNDCPKTIKPLHLKPELHGAAAAKLLQLCLTLRPHRRQPTRLLHPQDSPVKNTGVGCHFLLQHMKVKSLSRVRLCATPQTQPTRLLCAQDSLGKNTGVGCCFLLPRTASVQFTSVAQSCQTLCDPMNRSTPGLPVHHQLPEFTQTHVH